MILSSNKVISKTNFLAFGKHIEIWISFSFLKTWSVIASKSHQTYAVRTPVSWTSAVMMAFIGVIRTNISSLLCISPLILSVRSSRGNRSWSDGIPLQSITSSNILVVLPNLSVRFANCLPKWCWSARVMRWPPIDQRSDAHSEPVLPNSRTNFHLWSDQSLEALLNSRFWCRCLRCFHGSNDSDGSTKFRICAKYVTKEQIDWKN